jgi:adenosylmethionine-8-amino-7-oxononanoate aminotransferase
MARQYHRQLGDARKYKTISHYRAYHGVTGHALAASGWPWTRSPYEPLAAGFVHVHAPDAYRPPFDVDPAEVGRTYARLVEEVIVHEAPETISSFITEPILMSAGVVVPPRDYLPRIRELCDAHDIVLIFDEMITGFGRTGRLFAADLFETWPDILVLGKGMTGGYAPLSAAVITERLAEAFWGETADAVQFAGGHTYAGNPVACAVGLEALRQTVELNVARNAVERGAQALERLHALAAELPQVGDVRGEGLLLGLEFVADPATRTRFPAEAGVGVRIREEARRRGLLLRASHWMAVFAPPLTTTADELDAMLDIFETSVGVVLGSRQPRDGALSVPAAGERR